MTYDARDMNYSLPGVEFNERCMTVTVDGTSYPAHFELCELCNGRGTHVNPSIDSQGLGNEDFAEDVDFKEAYFSGAYDVQCACCQGRRVMFIASTAEGIAAVAEVAASEADIQAEYEAERRMGA